MRIINLIENTEGAAGCAAAHGLSFYIETEKHKLLMDLGPSEETLRNAEKLGIDLAQADTVVISHGHYDHAGGVLPFAAVNPDAPIYMQASATGDYYNRTMGEDGKAAFRYIGINRKIPELPQLRLIEGDYEIDEELSLFVVEQKGHELPFTNRALKEKTGEGYVQDSFAHEQFLVIREGERRVLLSGCGHNGILNILEEYRRKYGGEPDAVISGFHLMKKTKYTDSELEAIIDIAKELGQYRCRFYTGHCTSLPAFDIMKLVLGDQLQYVHSGDEIRLPFGEGPEEEAAQQEKAGGPEPGGEEARKEPSGEEAGQESPAGPAASKEIQKKKRRSTFMKWHKFFAWASVFCFIMTMVTGYRRK